MYTKQDIEILRALAREKAEIAKDPRQAENIKLWSATNDNKMTKPPIYIYQLPWNEMDYEDELTLQTTDPYLREIELKLRREIYCWKHLPGNMVVTDVFECPIVFHNSGFGISEDVDVVKTDDTSDVASRHFNIQIRGMDDIHKIKEPVITVDHEQTQKNFDLLQEIFGDILKVEKTGIKGVWFAPWDNLIRLTGIEEAMMDLILQPEYIDKLVERYVDVSLIMLERYKELGLWASNNDNVCVGSGGYGYCSDLEPADQHRENTPTSQIWGCGNAQIFSEVSEKMHWDFSLKHELRWLEKFGLTYYGCCEPLQNKMDILQKIPNLRKVSMSPWSKIDKVVDMVGKKYVLSCKPSPAIFAEDTFRPEQAKADILDILTKANGASLELIMKDVSTVRYQPQRVWGSVN
ncbi:MAG: hypothetical protein WCX81_05840 [Monoglobales bacterium]